MRAGAGFALILLTTGTLAQARVFDYKDSSLAAFLRATGGLSSIAQTPFKESSGSNTTVDGTTKYQYSGELGFALGLGSDARIRLGAELIQHRPVSDAAGTNPAGTERFKLDSSVSVFNPNLTLEYAFKT